VPGVGSDGIDVARAVLASYGIVGQVIEP